MAMANSVVLLPWTRSTGWWLPRGGGEFFLCRVRHQCSLYADDAILFFSASTTETARIKRLLEIFGNASGLVANLGKCSLSTIAASDEVTGELAEVLGCRVAPFPVVYLGLITFEHQGLA